MINNAENYHTQAMELAERALEYKRKGDSEEFIYYLKLALDFEEKAANELLNYFDIEPSRSILYKSAINLALDIGDYYKAKEILEKSENTKVNEEFYADFDVLKKTIEENTQKPTTSMANQYIDQAKNICITLLSSKKTVSEKDIREAISNVLKIFPDLEVEKLYKYLEATFSVFSEDYKILDADYKPWLKNKKAAVKWNFWNRYISYLQPKIAPDTLNKLDNLTDDILDRLIDPSTPGPWDRRGMVVGQVQSGKTGNYTGLINKAADSGYKLIIVLAGMHDSLRSQTQIRVDEGFLGFNTQTAMNFTNAGNRIGVGKFNTNLAAHSLTTSHLNGDFKRQTAQGSGINIRGTDPIILVIKKNGSILKNLISWLAVRGDKMDNNKIIIRDLPMLLIDDEADNASINVSKNKVSTINGCIRVLLSLFDQSAYVGYTATPFANIFIPLLDEAESKGVDLTIKDYEFTVGQDLFPRDFIINIPAPSNYIGPAKVFGLPGSTSSDDAEEPLPIVIPVNDYQAFDDSNNQEQFQNFIAGVNNDFKSAISFVPNKHKKDDVLPEELPPSLKYGIKCFILSCTARRVRKQIEFHNSMLVHVSRYIRWQDRIAHLVDAELKFYQRQIEFNQGELISELEKIWNNEFVPKTNQVIRDTHIYIDPEINPISWSSIMAELRAASSKIEVRAVHGDKNIAGLSHHNISPLDYFLAQEQGNYLSVIAVGGDKLSRGLTLEGLTISYYLRASKMYDTLMQMGRWFGYRPGYGDLCRLFTSQELIDWYKHITIASEEVRAEFDYMFLLNRQPKDYGLKVRTHPGVLKITAANKFRYKEIMQLSYSGELEQTYKFKIDNKQFEKNFEATNNLISSLGRTHAPFNSKTDNQKFIWQGEKNHTLITQFLSKFRIGREIIDLGKMIDYINAQIKHGNLLNWTVALISNTQTDNTWIFEINGEKTKVGLTDRKNVSQNETEYEIAKAMIISPNHEMIDLTDDKINIAKTETESDWKKWGKKEIPKLPSGFRIKLNREEKNGLLLIYPLNNRPEFKYKENKRIELAQFPVIGFAVSFPNIKNDEKVEYAVNEQFINEFDYPEELDIETEENG
ncbi:MAG: Z1 domain-containing protein [Bacteroidia bacterium]